MLSSSDSVTSTLPPPISTRMARLPPRSTTLPTARWISRDSSSPLMISTVMPVSRAIRSISTSLLRASRRALVATARTRVTMRSPMVLRKRRKASVADCMVGSVIWPWEKASAPNRTGTRTPSMT